MYDPLLDRILHYEPVNRDNVLLSDAVRSVGRLVLDRDIPPVIEVNDDVRRGQIKSRSARTKRDAENRRIVLLKRINKPYSVLFFSCALSGRTLFQV